ECGGNAEWFGYRPLSFLSYSSLVVCSVTMRKTKPERVQERKKRKRRHQQLKPPLSQRKKPRLLKQNQKRLSAHQLPKWRVKMPAAESFPTGSKRTGSLRSTPRNGPVMNGS